MPRRRLLEVIITEEGNNSLSFGFSGMSLGGERHTPEFFRLGEGSDLHLLFAACSCNRKLEKELLPADLTTREKQFLSRVVKEFDDKLHSVVLIDAHLVTICFKEGVIPEDLELGIVGALCSATSAIDASVSHCSCAEEPVPA